MYKLSFTLIALMLGTTLVYPGQNSGAELYINFGTDTLTIDSVTNCRVSDTLIAAIQISKSVNVYSFQTHIGFDTAHLQFLSGTREIGTNKNHLESQGGTISTFICAYVRTDSTKISIGASLTGNNKTDCPSGSGFLAFLKFRKKTSDTTAITIYDPLIEDVNSNDDTTIKTAKGIIFPGSSGVFRRSNVQNKFILHKSGDIITIYSPEVTPLSMQLFSIDGRCVKRISSCTQRTTIALPALSGNGFYVLRVLSSNNNYSSLMINN